MNGYLVVLRHTMDDIPLRLFASESDAWHFAAGVEPDAGEREKQVVGTDESTPCTPCTVFVYQFEQGLLSAATLVKGFT